MWLSRPHRERGPDSLSQSHGSLVSRLPWDVLLPLTLDITVYYEAHLDYSWTHSRSLCRAELETPLASSESRYYAHIMSLRIQL